LALEPSLRLRMPHFAKILESIVDFCLIFNYPNMLKVNALLRGEKNKLENDLINLY
jgi:hypothetical protein